MLGVTIAISRQFLSKHKYVTFAFETGQTGHNRTRRTRLVDLITKSIHVVPAPTPLLKTPNCLNIKHDQLRATRCSKCLSVCLDCLYVLPSVCMYVPAIYCAWSLRLCHPVYVLPFLMVPHQGLLTHARSTPRPGALVRLLSSFITRTSSRQMD